MDNWWFYVLVVLVAIIIIQALTKKRASPKEPADSENTDTQFQYRKKNFLTADEKSFLVILRELAKYNLLVVPQINLATVVQKVGEFRYQNELYRNIDFGVFDKEYNLLLLIELNDSSHSQKDRQKRDSRVKDIVAQAEIKLMTFYTDKPNKPEYVIDRILQVINVQK